MNGPARGCAIEALLLARRLAAYHPHRGARRFDRAWVTSQPGHEELDPYPTRR